MKFLVACTLLVASTLAEPPVDNKYLPPNQRSNGFEAPSNSYGAPGLQGQTDAIFGARTSGSSYNSRPLARRPSSQYGAPSNQYIPPSNQNRPTSQFGAQGPSSQYGTPARTPSSQYGAPSRHKNASPSQYNAPSSQYNAPSSQYNAPSSQFNAPTSQYSAPSSQNSAPSSQYNAPISQYSAPSSQYNAPSSQYNAPSNQYIAPSSQFNAPSSQYGTPSQSRTPSSQYGAPSRQYEAPGSEASKPSSEYGLPSAQPLSQYNAPGFKGQQGYSQGVEQNRQYLPPGAGRNGNGYDDGSNNEAASYSFEYMVKDEPSGNDFGHRETREGDRAEGLYYVVLPDGRKQTVEYEADEDGYKPRISYEDTRSQGYDDNAQTYDGQSGSY